MYRMQAEVSRYCAPIEYISQDTCWGILEGVLPITALR